jgi:hypothetical protein
MIALFAERYRRGGRRCCGTVKEFTGVARVQQTSTSWMKRAILFEK